MTAGKEAASAACLRCLDALNESLPFSPGELERRDWAGPNAGPTHSVKCRPPCWPPLSGHGRNNIPTSTAVVRQSHPRSWDRRKDNRPCQQDNRQKKSGRHRRPCVSEASRRRRRGCATPPIATDAPRGLKRRPPSGPTPIPTTSQRRSRRQRPGVVSFARPGAQPIAAAGLLGQLVSWPTRALVESHSCCPARASARFLRPSARTTMC